MFQGIAAMMTALTNIIILGAVIKDKESFLQKLNFISYNTNLELKIEKRMFQSRGYFRFSLALSDCMYGHVHFSYNLRRQRLFLASDVLSISVRTAF